MFTKHRRRFCQVEAKQICSVLMRTALLMLAMLATPVLASQTANLFKAGHRIRIDVSSSNFPKYDVNPNTGAPEGTGRTRRVAGNSVFCDRLNSSSLTLRSVPPDRLSYIEMPPA